MTKYIFHGGRAQSDSENNNLFYAELIKDVPNNGVMLLVYFASRSEDNSEKASHVVRKCQEFSVGKELDTRVATTENFLDQVAYADAIYFSGGSTKKLLDTLGQFPNLKSSFENKDKTVAGSSAGAYALSTLYSSHYEDKVEAGLAIVPVKVVTHYKSETMPPKDGAVQALTETREDLPLIVLQEEEHRCVIT